jgi:prenyltransferase beta subunit
MRKAVSRSETVLKDSTPLVVDFLTAAINPDGGFKGRDDRSDLYYTVFGLEALIALGGSFPGERTADFLQKFIKQNDLDLIHLAALIRCYANLSDNGLEKSLRSRFIKKLERFRCKDGGCSNKVGLDNGTIYGCFFALAAYQDLQLEIPDYTKVIECIQALSTPDGAFTNNQKIQTGSTNATAAAMMVLHHLHQPVDKKTVDWLLTQCTSNGGFRAMPAAPIPDLLSTATALHALVITGFEIDSVKDRCLDFIDSLWCSKGAFYGNCTDTTLDCEYTYYGLLALGNLG